MGYRMVVTVYRLFYLCTRVCVCVCFSINLSTIAKVVVVCSFSHFEV